MAPTSAGTRQQRNGRGPSVAWCDGPPVVPFRRIHMSEDTEQSEPEPAAGTPDAAKPRGHAIKHVSARSQPPGRTERLGAHARIGVGPTRKPDRASRAAVPLVCTAGGLVPRRRPRTRRHRHRRGPHRVATTRERPRPYRPPRPRSRTHPPSPPTVRTAATRAAPRAGCAPGSPSPSWPPSSEAASAPG